MGHCRLVAVLAEFRARLPNTDVILLGILPRDAHVLSGPPAYEWPNRMTLAIQTANHELQVSLPSHSCRSKTSKAKGKKSLKGNCPVTEPPALNYKAYVS